MEALVNRALEPLPGGVGVSERGAPRAAPVLPPVKSLDERIASIFLSVGIPAHIKGYHFLREAVKLVYAKRTLINAITKQLYPAVAEAFDTTPSKVERAIRHAIEVAWSRGKIENVNTIFGYTIYSKQEKPTNGEFIALIADKLLMDDLTRSEQTGSFEPNGSFARGAAGRCARAPALGKQPNQRPAPRGACGTESSAGAPLCLPPGPPQMGMDIAGKMA